MTKFEVQSVQVGRPAVSGDFELTRMLLIQVKMTEPVDASISNESLAELLGKAVETSYLELCKRYGNGTSVNPQQKTFGWYNFV